MSSAIVNNLNLLHIFVKKMNVLSLPNELLCLIFSDDNLNFDDLRHLMFTCQRFLEIIRGSNVIWSSKFNARYM